MTDQPILGGEHFLVNAEKEAVKRDLGKFYRRKELEQMTDAGNLRSGRISLPWLIPLTFENMFGYSVTIYDDGRISKTYTDRK